MSIEKLYLEKPSADTNKDGVLSWPNFMLIRGMQIKNKPFLTH